MRLICLSLILSLSYNAKAGTDPPIGPGDTIEIQVFQEPDLSLTLVVSEDGLVRYPLLESLQVSGMTAYALAEEIERLLLDGSFIRTASVQVRILERKSSQATLAGTVNTPGAFPLDPGERLREFISKHGGIREPEAAPLIVISHIDGATTGISRRSLFHPRNEEDRELNVLLRHQDTVIIPAAEMFYVQGAVMLPRGFYLTEEMTLRDAIGLAGGWSEEAGTEIIWQRAATEGTPTMVLNIPIGEIEDGETIANAPIGPGDTIYVEQFNSFYVSGEVSKPGGYLWRDGLTLTEAVIVAGDLTNMGSSRVSLRRKDASPEEEPSKHNLSAIKKGKEEDPIVRPGDIVIVNQNWRSIPALLQDIFPVFGSASVSYPLK